MLYQSTCVGLRYDQKRLSLEVFLVKINYANQLCPRASPLHNNSHTLYPKIENKTKAFD